MLVDRVPSGQYFRFHDRLWFKIGILHERDGDAVIAVDVVGRDLTCGTYEDEIDNTKDEVELATQDEWNLRRDQVFWVADMILRSAIKTACGDIQDMLYKDLVNKGREILQGFLESGDEGYDKVLGIIASVIKNDEGKAEMYAQAVTWFRQLTPEILVDGGCYARERVYAGFRLEEFGGDDDWQENRDRK